MLLYTFPYVSGWNLFKVVMDAANTFSYINASWLAWHRLKKSFRSFTFCFPLVAVVPRFSMKLVLENNFGRGLHMFSLDFFGGERWSLLIFVTHSDKLDVTDLLSLATLATSKQKLWLCRPVVRCFYLILYQCPKNSYDVEASLYSAHYLAEGFSCWLPHILQTEQYSGIQLLPSGQWMFHDFFKQSVLANSFWRG